MPVEVKCDYCGKETQKYPSEIERRKHNFCSRECAGKYNPESRKYKDKEWLENKYVEEKKSIDDIAELCGCSKNTIWVWLGNHDIPTRSQSETLKLNGKVKGENNPMYGVERSEETKEKIRENLPDYSGENNPFYDKSHDEDTREVLSKTMKEGWEEGNVREKREEWLNSEEGIKTAVSNLPDEVLKGKEHPAWKGGHLSYGWKWEIKVDEALERADYECERCDTDQEEHRDKHNGQRLHTHHIVPYRICQEHRLDNLIVLCIECHNVVEKWDILTRQEALEKIKE